MRSIGKTLTAFFLTALVALAPLSCLKEPVSAAGTMLPSGYTDEADYWRSMGTDYYYEQLPAAQKTLYKRIDNECMRIMKSEVDLTTNEFDINVTELGLSIDDAQDVGWIFFWSEPEYFFLSNAMGYYSWRGNYYLVMCIYPEFQSASARNTAKELVSHTINDYVSAAADAGMTETMERVVFQKMCDNIEYAYSGNDYDQSMYSAIQGETVCAGYSKLFASVMNMLDIPCACVTGPSHAWNVINLYGYWYNVDVTNGDQSYGYYYKYYNSTDRYEGSLDDYFEPYYPEILYDDIASDWGYTTRYFTTDGNTYYIVNEVDNSYGYIAHYVSSSGTQQVPSAVAYGGHIFTVNGAPPYIPDGWNKIDGVWYYYENGLRATGWQKIGTAWYYFNADGVMQTGWVTLEGSWYYFDASGAMCKGWKKISGKWYYFDGSGELVTGWKKISNKYYYFNSNGAMQTGWIQDGGKYYYLGSDGAMCKSWQKINGVYYYFDGTGAMVTGWKKISGVYYYFSTSGVMQTGWLDYNGKTYYLRPDGSMAAGCSEEIDGVVYRFNSSGACTNPPG